MPIKVLMIALNRAFLSVFERCATKYELYLLEERELYNANPEAYASSAIKELRFGEYQQSAKFLEEVREWHRKIGFDIVVPGMEYSVPGAHLFASRAGLLTPGDQAITAFTDKYQLRLMGKRIGISQPRFAQVRDVQNVRSFFQETPIVLKPTNRRASVGVIRIDQSSEIQRAWDETTGEDEGKRVVSRNLRWNYMAEDFVDGYEVSIESLVANDSPCFHNITSKQTIGGRYFAEIGHTVPAPVDTKIYKTLISMKELLLRGLHAHAGVFHSEWKIDSTGPKLIECAARMPGDLIPQLIQQAYGFDFYEAVLQVLLGQTPSIPLENQYVAAVRFFKPSPGRFERVEGEELLRSLPEIFEYEVNIKPGQEVPPFKNSWTRAGYYALRCENLPRLEEVIETIENRVRFVVSEYRRNETTARFFS